MVYIWISRDFYMGLLGFIGISPFLWVEFQPSPVMVGFFLGPPGRSPRLRVWLRGFLAAVLRRSAVGAGVRLRLQAVSRFGNPPGTGGFWFVSTTRHAGWGPQDS